MSLPFSRDGIRCLVPQPRRVTSWLLPFEPFQMTLWLCIAICLLLETMGLLFALKMENRVKPGYTWMQSLQFGYVTTLKLFISQGTSYVVNSSSVRMILFSCYIIDIIITSIYGGGLASILTIPAFEEAADNVDRLVQQKLIWSGTTIDWILSLQKTQDEKFKHLKDLFRVYSASEIHEMISTDHIGLAIERLQFGHFAIPNYIDQAIVDRMKLMIEDMYFEYVVGFMPRTSPLLEKFNNFCLMMQSSGLLKFWEWKVVAQHLDEKLHRQIEASANTNFGNVGPVQLGISNFAGIIVVWIIGIVLSLLIFSLELLSNRSIKSY